MVDSAVPSGPPLPGPGPDLESAYRVVVEHHPHAVLGLDLDGRITEINPASQALSGYDAQQLLRMNIAALVLPADLPAARRALAGVAAGEMQRLTLAIHRCDATVADLEVTALPLGAPGAVRGALVLAVDLTHQRRQRRELDLTRELAARAGGLRRDFALRMSHEIRTPLTSILATAEFLDTTALDPEQQDMVRTLRQSGARLCRLVDDILDFSAAAELEGAEHLTEIFDLHAVLTDAVDLVRAPARLKGLRVELRIAPEVPRWVDDHPSWTFQVLVNLLSNAVAHTDTGWVEVAVGPTVVPGSGPGIVYRISDTGTGIAPDQLAGIFDHRDRPAHDQRGGASLGLSIVKQLVDISGGTVVAESTLGQGSSFIVTLPARTVTGPS